MPAMYAIKDKNGGTINLSYQELLKQLKSGSIDGNQLAKYEHDADWVPVERIVSAQNAMTKKVLKVFGLLGVIFVAMLFGYLTFGESFQPVGIALMSALLIMGGAITFGIGRPIFFLGYLVFFGLMLMEGESVQPTILALMAACYSIGGVIQFRLHARKQVKSETASSASKEEN